MSINRLLGAALLAAAAPCVQAEAFAEVKLTHFTGGINDVVEFDFDASFSNSSLASGTSFDSAWLYNTDDTQVFQSSRPLVAGETFYLLASYTITLRDDGGTAVRDGFVVPADISGGISTFGEAAYARVLARYNPLPQVPGVEATLELVEHDTGDNFVPNQLTFSGMVRATYTVTDDNTPFPQAELWVSTVSFAQSALIPEPGTWALMLGGLGLLGAARISRLPGRRRPGAAGK